MILIKKISLLFTIFLASLLAHAEKSPRTTERFLADASGSTEFLAIGRPSALKIVGKGKGPNGAIEVVGQEAKGSLDMELESLDTGIKMRNTHMKEKYLETGKYAKANLTITELKLPAAGEFKQENVPFRGKLNLHGVEKDIAGTCALERKNGNLDVAANFEIKVSDYNIDVPKFSGITMADDVKVSTKFVAKLAAK